MRRSRGPAALLLLLGLALACGGGGGGDGSSATAEITLENAEAISSDVLFAMLRSADLGALAAGVGSGEVLPAAAAAGGAAAGEGLARRIPRLEGSGGIAPSVVFDPRTEPCDQSGSVTYSGDIDDPVKAGNRLSATFLDCVNLDEDAMPLPELDGHLAYVVLSLGGTLGTDFFRAELDLDFDDFEVTDGADAVEIDGSATTNYDATSPPLVGSLAEGTSLSWDLGAEAFELSRFISSLIDDTSVDGGDSLSEGVAAGKYSLDGRGRLSGTSFSGEAHYDTVPPLDEDEDEDGQFLVGGDLLIRGADDVTIRLIELAPPDVELQVDADGNGEIDASEIVDTTWGALLD